MAVWTQDEAGPYQAIPQPGSHWRPTTGPARYPHEHIRHGTAKLYLDVNKGDYDTVRRALAHRSINTTTTFYTGLETAQAVRHFDETILNLRNKENEE